MRFYLLDRVTEMKLGKSGFAIFSMLGLLLAVKLAPRESLKKLLISWMP